MSHDQNTPAQISMFDAMSLLEFSEDKLYVSSLDVAHHFEKQHNNVLRAIEALECSQEFRALNFERSSYASVQNKQIPIFRLTRDGWLGAHSRRRSFWLVSRRWN